MSPIKNSIFDPITTRLDHQVKPLAHGLEKKSGTRFVGSRLSLVPGPGQRFPGPPTTRHSKPRATSVSLNPWIPSN